MPNTIAQNLARLQAAKTAIGAAITAKGGTVASGDGLEEFATDIGTIPSGGGGGGTTSDAVNFYDYDGTVLHSYTAADFAQLSAMPSNPTHAGLTAQGWNWSLTDAKTYVASYGKLDIGQMYITDDGKTRLYIELTEGRLTPWLKIYLNANSELDIDWGDGSSHSTFASTSAAYSSEMHTYANAGSYIIAITVISGGFVLQSSNNNISTLLTNNDGLEGSPDMAYLNAIKRINIGGGITSIGSNAFQYCTSLASITIPNSVTSISNSALYGCFSLSSITIPNSVTSIGSTVLYNCPSITSITIPNSVTSIGSNAFQYCYSLATITIPSSVTSISSNAFQYCRSITSITIPNSVTSISSNAFQYCRSLSSVTIPSSVTSIGSGAFYDCYSLATITINKSSSSISGSPWGAITRSPTYTQIIWTG